MAPRLCRGAPPAPKATNTAKALKPTTTSFVSDSPPELSPCIPLGASTTDVLTPWVIACTNPRAEKQLVRYLLTNFPSIPYALPYTAKRSASRNLHHSPLLPGFVFVACPLASASNPNPLTIPEHPDHPIDRDEYNLNFAALTTLLLSSHLVHSFIRPTPLYQPQLRREISLLTTGSSPENRRLVNHGHRSLPGSLVRIHSGPLRGFTATVDAFTPASSPDSVTLVLRLQILGTVVSVELPLADIELV